ncbi:uncharacterized protein LOC124162267 [Ischnura elegans]|uniref:uncharacterized protein LOC124162267 n=1 Tax=Ischnura elegans TaxID=197161 RepID=UPI001ED89E09|nr:uncharacterized protein LOC124162267 [Ischnura elegans]XP_046394696.1 uncharacterized protein LOC124162267 [Ischnura elegans]
MPLNSRLSRKGGEGPSSDVVETRPKKPLALKRTPTFATLLRKEVLGLRSFDPMFRYSLTRLPEEEGGSAEARNQAGPGEGRCGAQWANIRDAVDRVVQQFCRGKPAHSGANGHCTGGGGVSPLADGELSALHSDVRVLLRTEPGAFIFEYLKDKLLPVTAAKVLEETQKRSAVDPADEAKGAVDPWKLCSRAVSDLGTLLLPFPDIVGGHILPGQVKKLRHSSGWIADLQGSHCSSNESST